MKRNKIVTYLELHCRGPAKLFLDEGVVRVAPTYSLWTRDVVDGQLPILKAENDFSHLIHANHLIASNVHWLAEV
jgi:hypothetical protein